jgi:hypothetical protein
VPKASLWEWQSFSTGRNISDNKELCKYTTGSFEMQKYYTKYFVNKEIVTEEREEGER